MHEEDKPRSLLMGSVDEPTTVAMMGSDTDEGDDRERLLISPLVSKVHAYLEEAEHSRRTKENNWIKAVKAFRATEDGDTFRESERFKPYIRTTTVKVKAGYAQIMESLLQNSRFPLMIEPTPLPEGVPEFLTNDPNSPDSQEDFGIGYEGDGRTLEAGATLDEPMWKESDPLYNNLQEGRDMSGGQFAQLSPAQRAAERMQKVIMDQLEESNAHTELRKSVFEACLLGTGVMKGVFTEEKTLHKWTDGVYTPEKRKFPKMHSVSTWDLYCDNNAMTQEDMEWCIERHRMSAKQMRDLKNRAYFRKDNIDKCITSGANYVERSFENTVREEDAIMDEGRLWEVLEYWGYISKEEALEAGLSFDSSIEEDQVHVNLWICGSEILRVMTNPFLPQRIPYFIFNYETDPYSLYGTGIPESMEDSQKMMNGFASMAVDNLALAGNLIFEVDETLLVAGQDISTMSPGKVLRKQGGMSGQAVQGIKFPSTANENMMMFREFRQIADESTGIPSVSHGQTGVTGVGRTSSGLNMILENASLNIKTVIRNIDDSLLQPMGKMLFYWNQQFNSDKIPKGDFDVVATGIRSYTKQEVKVQRLQTLLGLVQNPALAPMVKLPYIIRELVKGMDMDPEEVINDMDEAKIYAEIIGMAGGVQQGQQQQPEVPQGAPQGMAQAGDPSFTGNTEGAGNVGGVNGQEQIPM